MKKTSWGFLALVAIAVAIVVVISGCSRQPPGAGLDRILKEVR